MKKQKKIKKGKKMDQPVEYEEKQTKTCNVTI